MKLSQFSSLICTLIMCSSLSCFAELRKWNEKMQTLRDTFTEILPQLSETQPVTEATQKKLEASTKKLLDLAHNVNMGPGEDAKPLPPEGDPTLGFISGIFEREVKHAYQYLQKGQVAYARSVLKTATSYCIACHTRHDKGPDFPLSIWAR